MIVNKVSYRKNYIHIYIWQVLSIITGFVSLFIVVPFLSSNKTVYGIYSICTSLTIFFSYADLGFLGAARKYGAEFYVQNALYKEVKVVGFVAFLMFVVFAALATTVGVMAIWPKLLIPELQVGSDDFFTARWLLLILCFSSLVMLAQRIIITIYSIRVEDYKFQRVVTIGSLIMIISVFVFFSGGRYLIVPYYLFFQIVNLIVVVIGLLGIRKYGYKIIVFFKSFRFDKEQFHLTKSLSIAGLVGSLSMILYYELDSIVISQVLGVQMVAIYGIALTVLNIVRTYSSLVYSPYASRYNHYVGLSDDKGLIQFVRKLITTFDSIFILPITTVSLLALPFVISWVGEGYKESAILVSIMVFSFAPNFLNDPISSFFYAKEKSKILIKWYALEPIIYWAGVILLLINGCGLLSFAIFKTVASLTLSVAYLAISSREFKKLGEVVITFKELCMHLLIPLFFCIVLCYFVRPVMFYQHDAKSLLLNILIMSTCVIITLGVSLSTNSSLRITAISYLQTLIPKLKKL